MADDLNYGLHYREWHDESDEHMEQMCTILAEQLGPYLPPERNRPVLEIGCGMGFAMMTYQRLGFTTVKGVDIDTSQIEACKRRSLDVEQIDDLEAYLAGHVGEFGLVTMLDVLEHIPVASQINVLRAIQKAMAPGGRIIIQVPNASSIIAARWQYQDFTHVCSFTERSIRFALQSAGFPEVTVPALGNNLPRPSFRPARLLDKRSRPYLKLWLLRSVWRWVLEIESEEQDVSKLPLTVNLFAIADKPGVAELAS